MGDVMFNSSALYIACLSNGQTMNQRKQSLKIYPAILGVWMILFFLPVRDMKL